ncbi:MAG: hypothetical protein RBQ72_04990 [Desulfobacterium sp.]|nr:hypothetical protein [Desulfobacterium sp.]
MEKQSRSINKMIEEQVKKWQYDMVINTGKITIDHAVTAMKAIAHKRMTSDIT